MTLKKQLNELKRNIPYFIDMKNKKHEMCWTIMIDNWSIIEKLTRDTFMRDIEIGKLALRWNGNFDASSEIDETVTILYYHLLTGVIEDSISICEGDENYESCQNLQKFKNYI